MQVACDISLERSQQGLKLVFKLHLNQRLAQEITDLQNDGSPNFGNYWTPNLGVLGQNDIWV
jgi:hypothetical protein